MKLTNNFSKSEFDCSCGCDMPLKVLHNVQKLANQLQALRNVVGTPIKINSGYRCLDYNDNVVKGASKNSQHKQGKAADIVINEMTPQETFELIDLLINEGELLQGGLSAICYIYTLRYKKNKSTLVMEINLILLVPDAMMVGWQYYRPDDNFNYSEVNIFLFFGQLQIRWNKDE